MKRAWAAYFVLTTACGSGANDGLGDFNQGVVATSPTGQICGRGSGGFSNALQGAQWGSTGDACSYGGGATEALSSESRRVASCFAGALVVQIDTVQPTDRCSAAAPGEVVAPIVGGECVQQCAAGVSRSGVVDVLSCPSARSTSARSLETPWSLADAAACASLRDSCPKPGDPCTGTEVCEGLYFEEKHPGGSTSYFPGIAWCANGSLRIVTSWLR